MPLRSRRDCSCATSMVTASTSLNACASSPISSSDVTSMTVGWMSPTSPPVRSDSTNAGSWRCDISRAAAVRRFRGPTNEFDTNQISISVSNMAKTAAPPYRRVSRNAAEAFALAASFTT